MTTLNILPAHERIMEALANEPGGLTVHELAQDVGMTNHRVSLAVHDLKTAGMLGEPKRHPLRVRVTRQGTRWLAGR